MNIDVYHDIPCPWCRIGKANLEAALRRWDGEPVTITWHPFLLDRGVPAAGVPARDFYQMKFGTENVAAMLERVRQAGCRAGVEFNFEDAIRAPDEGVAETAAAVEDTYRLGVTGVPFFVFDDRYALSGAQPPETILAAMRQTAQDRVTVPDFNEP